jgi:hypothetical protein
MRVLHDVVHACISQAGENDCFSIGKQSAACAYANVHAHTRMLFLKKEKQITQESARA